MSVKPSEMQPTGGARSRVVAIEPTRGWRSVGFAEVWEYRDLLWYNVLKNIKGKYRQMALGPLWIVLQPLINMVIFTMIFGNLAKLDSGGIPYPILTYSALIPWVLFQNSCQAACNSLVSQMGVISKVYFPRILIPISTTLSWLVDFGLSFVILLGLMLAYGYYPGWKIIFIPLYLLFLIITALGLGCWTAALNVRFRDVKIIVTHGLRMFMYLCPVAYSSAVIPERWQWLFRLNPLYWVIEGFRWAMVGGQFGPEWAMVLPVLLAVILFVSGVFVFRKAERSVVDLL